MGASRFQARSRDLRGGRWSWTLKLAQKRLWVGRWSWAAKVDFFRFELFVNSSAADIVTAQTQQLKQQLRSAQVAGQWRGDTALILPLFWRRSTISPVFFGLFPSSRSLDLYFSPGTLTRQSQRTSFNALDNCSYPINQSIFYFMSVHIEVILDKNKNI